MIDDKAVMQQALPTVGYYGLNQNGYEVIALKAHNVLYMFDPDEITAQPVCLISDALNAIASVAQPVQPALDWLTAINQLYEKITPLPWGGAADGRGVGLRGNRWTANGGFSDVCKKSVSRHGGTHFDNIRFIGALANAWPTIQAAIAQTAHESIASAAIECVAQPVAPLSTLELALKALDPGAMPHPEHESLVRCAIAEMKRNIATHSALNIVQPVQPHYDKLLQIIAAAYQIAGACDMPVYILDVLANPERATQEQIDAMLPFVRLVQQKENK